MALVSDRHKVYKRRRFRLARHSAGVSVKVTQGSTQVDALPLYVSGMQVNAIMPSGTPPGMVSVRVTFNNVPSSPARRVW